MNTKKYLQTIINHFCIDNFVSNMFFRCLCIGLFLFSSLCCFADDYRKETVGDRVVTERRTQRYSFYLYTIDKYDSKMSDVKSKKKPYIAFTTVPAWTNYPLHRQETDKLVEYCRSVFDNNKRPTVDDMHISVGYILVDDGSVICTRIKSDVCLFDLYTPKEISDMFDKISTFKYSTPLVLYPKEGYHEADMSIW